MAWFLLYRMRKRFVKRACVCLLIAPMMMEGELSFGNPFSGPIGLPVPPSPGAGFAVSLGPEFYGTGEQPLKNGDIFNFIDGGGVVYLRYGFSAVAHTVFADKNKNLITVDIFDMGNDRSARNAYADESICPSGYDRISIGVEAKAYRFEPDYFIYFVKGPYLVYCHVNNDALSRFLNAYAKILALEVL